LREEDTWVEEVWLQEALEVQEVQEVLQRAAMKRHHLVQVVPEALLLVLLLLQVVVAGAFLKEVALEGLGGTYNLGRELVLCQVAAGGSPLEVPALWYSQFSSALSQ
jgi:hypothetical protein